MLIKNGAEFADSFIENLLRIIEHMDSGSKQSQKSQDVLAVKFPGLAMPNEPSFDAKPVDDKNSDLKGSHVVDEAMLALEALAPSKNEEIKTKPEKRQRSVEKSRKRSRSRDNSKRSKRSRSRDRRSRRSRSRNRRDRRQTSRSRDRSRDRKQRSRSRDRRRGSKDRRTRNKSQDRRKRSATPDLPVDPEPQKIYSGKVANIVPFGCFVQLEGLKKRWEGLVHISQLRREGRVIEVGEVVSRGQKVWVSCLKK